jgi:hypothetical protein
MYSLKRSFNNCSQHGMWHSYKDVFINAQSEGAWNVRVMIATGRIARPKTCIGCVMDLYSNIEYVNTN